MSETNFLALNFTKTSLLSLFQRKRAFNAFFIIISCLFFISSCSTKTTTTRTDSPSKITKEQAHHIITAEEKLNLAKSLNAQLAQDNLFNDNLLNNNVLNATSERYGKTITTQQATIVNLLIEASELFLLEKNYTKALWLANQLTQIQSQKYPKSTQNDYFDNHYFQNHYRLLLVKANSLLALNYPEQALHQLQTANELIAHVNNQTNTSFALTLTYYQVLANILTIQKRPVLALEAQMNAFALDPNASAEDIRSIWAQLEVLTQWQIADLINNKTPFIEGWAQLVNYSHKFGTEPKDFLRYLNLWQQKYSTHPAVIIIDELQSAHLSERFNIKAVENIAILLPLTGSQQKAGLAAQQGILAAYNNNTSRNLFFIDTNKVDWQSLAPRLSQLNVDHIIGPLLKPNVEAFLNLSRQQVSLQIPTLLLNLPSNQVLAEYQTVLSMRPEDEAVQAAATLSQHSYTKPIILSHNDRVSKRIAIAFREQWQSSTGNVVDIVYFDEGKQMQISLKDSLDVSASETRIKQLNSRLKYNIEAEPRNRRDIDMIYLVGTAAQTRLIKPYIDVNISPFAKVIPVYASSRSHSNFDDKNNTSSTSDLQGLTFTQMPWLLNSTQQNKELNLISDNLWPKRTDSLSRIFAMGVDSYHLLGKISLMQNIPYIRHFGQTGVLKLNSENILTRSLIWGQYNNDKVVEFAME